MSQLTVLRAIEAEEKGRHLSQAIEHLRSHEEFEGLYEVDPAAFSKVPGSPFAYWVPESVRDLFVNLPPFENERRTAKQGLATADDFRFVRLWWEVAPERILDAQHCPFRYTEIEEFQAWCRQRTRDGRRWVPFAKGGSYSPFYADLHLVVNWENDGEQVKEYVVSRYPYLNGKWEWVVKNSDYYFRPGLTWPRRTNGLSFRPLVAGAIFGDKGPALFDEKSSRDQLLALCAVVNSDVFGYCLSALVARTELAQSYEVGIVQKVPVPRFDKDMQSQLARMASQVSAQEANRQSAALISMLFSGSSFRYQHPAESDSATTSLIAGLEHAVSNLYAVEVGGMVGAQYKPPVGRLRLTRRDLIEYALGCTLGRWDIRYATGELEVPELPDPFAPLPVCSPGMLQGEDRLPLREPPAGYPLAIDPDGILVDDEHHENDVMVRIRDVFELLFDDASAAESESCELLGVADLREYFRKKTGGFFQDHIKRYSMSRRKAPIYWLLQSNGGNYGLWLYYHRLDGDTLFKALESYVRPKLRLEGSRLEALRAERQTEGVSGQRAKRLERELDQQENLLGELEDFRDKLQWVADLNLEPDLDDGVVLNIAPLHDLVPWSEAEKYWKKILKREYGWSTVSKQLEAKGLLS